MNKDKAPDGVLSEDQAIDALDDLPLNDPEYSHNEAEAILCAFLRSEGFDEVAAAYIEARVRCGWDYE